MHTYDPLNAWIIKGHVDELDIPNAHLSVKYMKNTQMPNLFQFNITGTGFVVVADTQSEKPKEWSLCYY